MKTDEQKENEVLVDSMLERGVAGGKGHQLAVRFGLRRKLSMQLMHFVLGVFSFEDMATVISSFQSRMKAARPLHYTLGEKSNILSRICITF